MPDLDGLPLGGPPGGPFFPPPDDSNQQLHNQPNPDEANPDISSDELGELNADDILKELGDDSNARTNISSTKSEAVSDISSGLTDKVQSKQDASQSTERITEGTQKIREGTTEATDKTEKLQQATISIEVAQKALEKNNNDLRVVGNRILEVLPNQMKPNFSPSNLQILVRDRNNPNRIIVADPGKTKLENVEVVGIRDRASGQAALFKGELHDRLINGEEIVIVNADGTPCETTFIREAISREHIGLFISAFQINLTANQLMKDIQTQQKFLDDMRNDSEKFSKSLEKMRDSHRFEPLTIERNSSKRKPESLSQTVKNSRREAIIQIEKACVERNHKQQRKRMEKTAKSIRRKSEDRIEAQEKAYKKEATLKFEQKSLMKKHALEELVMYQYSQAA